MLLMRMKNILRTISMLCLSFAMMATYANDTTQRAALRPQPVSDIRLLQNPEFDNDGGVQYLRFMRNKNQIMSDHLGTLAVQNQGQSDVRLIKNILQNAPVSLFNTSLIAQNPNVYRALNDTLAFYQRRLTNLLLLSLLSVFTQPQQADFHKPYFYLTNDHDGKVNLFDLIHAYHGEKFIDQCFVPLVENSPLKLTAKGQRVFLTAIGDYYVGAPDPEHCHQRTVHWQKKWDALRYLPASVIQKRLETLIAIHRLNHPEVGRNAYYFNNKVGERINADQQGVRLTTLVHDMQQAINHDEAAKVAWTRFILHPSSDNAENFLKKENAITSHSTTINKKHKAQLAGIKVPTYSAGSEGINIHYDDVKPASKKQINDLAKNVLRQLAALKNGDNQSIEPCCPGPCCPDPMGHLVKNKVQRLALALQYDLANVKTDGTAEDLVGGLWPKDPTLQNTDRSLNESYNDVASLKTSHGRLAKQKLDEQCGQKTKLDDDFKAIGYSHEKFVYETPSGQTQALIKISLNDMPVPPSSGAFDGPYRNKSKKEVS